MSINGMKSYQVWYEVIADTQNATATLNRLGSMGATIAQQLAPIEGEIKKIHTSLNKLRGETAFEFKPVIDTTTFQNQLNSMVEKVQIAARQMHEAISQGLMGVNQNSRVVGKDTRKAFGNKTEKEIKDELMARGKRLKKLNKDIAKSMKSEDYSAVSQFNVQKANLRNDIADLNQLYKEFRAAARITQSAQAKVTETTQATTTKAKSGGKSKSIIPSNVASSIQSNVDTQLLTQWHSLFGNKASHNLTISANVTTALEEIDKVVGALESAKGLSVLTITPLVDEAKLATAKTQLEELKRLSEGVMAPFTGAGAKGKDTSKGKSAGKGSLKDGLALLSKADKAKYDAAKSNVASYTSKLKEAEITASAKDAIDQSSLTPAVKKALARAENDVDRLPTLISQNQTTVDELEKKAMAKLAKAKTAGGATPASSILEVTAKIGKVLPYTGETIIPVIGELSKVDIVNKECGPVMVNGELNRVTFTAGKEYGPVMVAGELTRVDFAAGKTYTVNVEGMITKAVAAEGMVVDLIGQIVGVKKQIAKGENLVNVIGEVSSVTAKAGKTFKVGVIGSIDSTEVAKGLPKKTVKVKGSVSELKTSGKPKALDIIAKITHIENALTESLPVNVKINPAQVSEALALVPQQTLNVGIHILTENLQQQVTAIQSQVQGMLAPIEKTVKGAKAKGKAETKEAESESKGAVVGAKEKKTSVKGGGKKGAKISEEKATGTANEQVITAKVNLDTTGLQTQLNAVKGLTVKAGIQLNWAKGAVGRNEQLKAIETALPPLKVGLKLMGADLKAQIEALGSQTVSATLTPVLGKAEELKKTATSQIPPIDLVLNTDAAIAKLNEFIGLIKDVSKQTINLNATGAKAAKGATAKGTTVSGFTNTASGTSYTTTATSTPANAASTFSQTAGTPYTSTTTSATPASVKGATAVSQAAATAMGVSDGNDAGKTRKAAMPSAESRYATIRQNAAIKASKEKADNRLRARKRSEYSKTINSDYARRQAELTELFTREERELNKLFGGTGATALNNAHLASAGRSSKNLASLIDQQMKTPLSSSVRGAMIDDAKIAFGSGLTPYEQKLKAAEKQATQAPAKVATPPLLRNLIDQRLGLNGTMGARQAMLDDARAAFSQLTPYEKKTAAPTGYSGSGASKVYWGSGRPDASLAPEGYSWVRTNKLARKLTGDQANAFQTLNAAKKEAVDQLRTFNRTTKPLIEQIRASNPETNKSLRLQRKATSALGNYQTAISERNGLNGTIADLERQIGSLQNRISGLGRVQKVLLRGPLFNKLNALEQQKAELVKQRDKAEDTANRNLQRHTRAVADRDAEIRAERNRQLAPLLAQQDETLSKAKSAIAAVKPYTQGYTLKKNETAVERQTQAIEQNTERQRILAKGLNNLRAFTSNDHSARVLMENRSLFKKAIKATGITPQVGMGAADKLSILKNVHGQMKASQMEIPHQIQSEIAKLERQLAAKPGRSSGGTRYVPAAEHPGYRYSKFAKWAYPFTGPTGFGSRTPMAVDMAKGMGVMFAIGGAMSAIGSSFSQAMEYQHTMESTKAMLQNGTDTYTNSGFHNMENIVREVGVKTKFSAPEVASAAKFLAMAGYDIEAINNTIRPVADLALIGNTDLGETADKMTNIMTTFSIKPENMRAAANIMASTATRSNTDLMMLAESAKYGGSVAKLYNKTNPDLFAETMALFGVMGNAGIQGSSAGTALRMMYMNVFSPNKKQKELLDKLDSVYGVKTKNKDGSFRSMASIIQDIANANMDDTQMAEVVGKLFRVTAQAGAGSALDAAKAMGISPEEYEELQKQDNKLVEKIGNKKGFSSLSNLIIANKEAAGGNISGAIAEQMQNTLSGLWAQVSSMFTEAIVKAFENRQGGFAQMLVGIRDYLARPESVQMLQNILDMVVEIAKIMGWVVKIWAGFYSMCPTLVKTWVVGQMLFNQVGMLLTPFSALVTTLGKLGDILRFISGVPILGAGAGMGRSAMNYAHMASVAAPLTLANGKTISGGAARRARNIMAGRTTLNRATEMALYGSAFMSPGGLMTRTKAPNIVGRATLSQAAVQLGTQRYYQRVAERANNMFGWNRFKRNRIAAKNWSLTNSNIFTKIGRYLKSTFFGIVGKLGTLLGALCNPITIVIAAFSALFYASYRLLKWINGNTDAQIQARKRSEKASAVTSAELKKQGQEYRNLSQIKGYGDKSAVQRNEKDDQRQANARQAQEDFKRRYSSIFNDISSDASAETTDKAIISWSASVLGDSQKTLALGTMADKYKNGALLSSNSKIGVTAGGEGEMFDQAYQIISGLVNEGERAKQFQKNQAREALRIEGANDPYLLEALNKVKDLREQLDSGKLTKDKYKAAVNAIGKGLKEMFPTNIASGNITPDELANASDITQYGDYQAGVFNVWNAWMRGDSETYMGKLNAVNALKGNKLKVFSEEWNKRVQAIIEDFKITDKFYNEQNKQFEDIEISMSMTKDGKIDTANIIKQIREKITGFKLNVNQLLSMIAHVYKMLTDQGFMSGTRNEIIDKLVEQKLSSGNFLYRSEASNYWEKYVKGSKKSTWSGISKKDFEDLYLGNIKEWTNSNGKKVSSHQTQKDVIWTAGAEAYDNEFKKPTEESAKDKTKNSGGSGSGSGGGSGSSTTDQHAYANNYDRSAATPTQIVNHIESLCKIDGMSIAANAEQRDLMNQMGNLVAQSVAQMFSIATNQMNTQVKGDPMATAPGITT